MERVSKLVRQLQREGISLQTVDAGGGLGIDYHAGSFDAAAKVREYAAALESALGAFDGPSADRAGALPGRAGRRSSSRACFTSSATAGRPS